MAVNVALTDAPRNASSSPTPANVAPPPLATTTTAMPPPISSPRLAHSPQPAIDSWRVSGGPPLSGEGHDDSRFRAARDELGGIRSFWRFRTAATSDEVRRMTAAGMPKLEFDEAGGDGAATGVPAAELFLVAPSVTHLSIAFPISPSLLHPSQMPTLRCLCIDQGDGAGWTGNQASATLNALQAPGIANIHVRNASLEMVQECFTFLDHIVEATIVDDGQKRHVKFVDRHGRTHAYDSGQLFGDANLFFNKHVLRNVTRLALGEEMLSHELSLLFGEACPRRLEALTIWFGAQHESVANRAKILDYRGLEQGACKGLKTLRLTRRPPFADTAPRNAPLRLPLSRETVEGFLTLLRGRRTTIGGGEVGLEQDGVAVEGLDS